MSGIKIIEKSSQQQKNNSESLSKTSSDPDDMQDNSIDSQKISPIKISSIENQDESLNSSPQINFDSISSSSNYPYLYPEINDPEFNKKIAEKKEFNDTRYDGKIYIANEQAEKLCNAEFQLLPHQQFVKNFLSFQTPYNSLLLYHGLGSGKTCSAIGIAEEMRDYTNQIGTGEKIIIIASPNVQENFKIQLFNESKLELVNGLWNIKSCIGNKFLREINPMNMKGLSKEKLITQINRLIKSSYSFYGYTEFANLIIKISDVGEDIKNKDRIIKNKLKNYFNNRLIIIDEVHNIRVTDDNKDKRAAQELFKLVKNVDNLRLLFLSATPLYNTYKEIVWLINIMNLNDKRNTINMKDIFNNTGDYTVNDDGKEIGKELLERKATGYISYVRGENPYTFPYRIWPNEFASSKSLLDKLYPRRQLNGKEIIKPIEHISLYISSLGEYQGKCYDYIINKLKGNELEKELTSFEKSESFGHILLQHPLEALNIVYPNSTITDIIDKQEKESDQEIIFNVKELVGKSGLENIMTYTKSLSPPSKTNFEYKNEIYNKYGRIFSQNEIGKYSGKIKEICNNIMNSDGIILIYSQYLDGGLVPIALALEEMGITRYGNVKSLFKTRPIENLDIKTYKNVKSTNSISAKYVMITGDKRLSPNNVSDLIPCTHVDNINGEKVKVILISQAGSEGLDFKNIRQVHILEPWYNMSRIEQIIGRAVRNCSHEKLPFIKRNVQLFLHGTILNNEIEESADLYVYRLAETKAIQIGKVNRVLKEISIDCLLNSEQMNFSSENMKQNIIIKLSNRDEIDYIIGDKPYSSQCDYMETCSYQCKPNNIIGEINNLSYSEKFIDINTEIIIQRIKQLMKEHYYYTKVDLIKHININKSYPIYQIYASLDKLINNNEYISDKYDRVGKLINIGEYYLYQPLELLDENISLHDRMIPIPYKQEKITFNINDNDNLPLKSTTTQSTNIEEDDIESSIQSSDEKDPIEDNKIITKIKIKKPKIEFDNGKIIIDEMFKNYNISKITDVKIIRGEDNWYKLSSVILKYLMKEENVVEAILDELLVCHIIEILNFNDTFLIINYLYNNSNLSNFEEKIKNYFKGREIINKEITGIYLQNNGEQQLIIKNKNIWKLAEPEDYNDLAPIIAKNIVPIKSLNNIVGFIGDFKKDYMIFKIKQLNKKRNKGARCDQAGKGDTIKILNLIVGEEKYTSANTKNMNHKQLCVLQEYILRLYDYNEKNSKRWFLDPSEAVLIGIEKL